MGQAFDHEGNVLGEAVGETKREVFERLAKEYPNAHELRIRSLESRFSEPTQEIVVRWLRAHGWTAQADAIEAGDQMRRRSDD